jgi:LysR family transcriptional activator of mexEF-oprN operon
MARPSTPFALLSPYEADVESLQQLYAVNLNLLVVFAVLMQVRNVTYCAQRLSLGQPAVSAALKKLRLQFDDPLFTRVGSSMRPTARAQRLEQLIGPALALLDKACNTPSHASMHVRASFSIGVNEGVRVGWLLDAFKPLLATTPGISLGFERTAEVARVACNIGYYAPRHQQSAFTNVWATNLVLVRCKKSRTLARPEHLIEREHVHVPFGEHADRHIHNSLSNLGSRRFAVQLPTGDGLEHVLVGTPWLALIPALEAWDLRHCEEVVVESLGRDCQVPLQLVMEHAPARSQLPIEEWFRAKAQHSISQFTGTVGCA